MVVCHQSLKLFENIWDEISVEIEGLVGHKVHVGQLVRNQEFSVLEKCLVELHLLGNFPDEFGFQGVEVFAVADLEGITVN